MQKSRNYCSTYYTLLLYEYTKSRKSRSWLFSPFGGFSSSIPMLCGGWLAVVTAAATIIVAQRSLSSPLWRQHTEEAGGFPPSDGLPLRGKSRDKPLSSSPPLSLSLSRRVVDGEREREANRGEEENENGDDNDDGSEKLRPSAAQGGKGWGPTTTTVELDLPRAVRWMKELQHKKWRRGESRLDVWQKNCVCTYYVRSNFSTILSR